MIPNFEGPDGPITIIRNAAAKHDSPALLIAAERLKQVLEAYFQEPALITTDEFTDIIGGIAIGYQLVTGEEFGQFDDPNMFARMREAFLAMNRPVKNTTIN